MGQSYKEKRRSEARWSLIISLFLTLLLFCCLALVLLNANAAFGRDVLGAQFYVRASISKNPCPPGARCPLAPSDRNHLGVWLFRQVRQPSGIRTESQRLIDIPLWK